MSRMTTFVFSALLAFMSLNTAVAQSTAAEKEARTRVVMQVSDDDPKKWNLALNNARNIQKDLGAKNVDIQIVAYGPGIGMLKADSEIAARVGQAKADGVQLSACENTMTAQKLKKDDMNPATGYVASGVVEIIRRQQVGYAYIRP